MIFIDLGAYDGRSTRLACECLPITKAYLFEPNPHLTIKPPPCDHEIRREMALDENGEELLYLSKPDRRYNGQGSTIYKEKKTGWLDTDNPIKVTSIDFAEFLWSLPEERVAVKCNVEGAEYRIIPRLAKDKALGVPLFWWVSWHNEKIEGLDEVHSECESVLREAGFTRRDPFCFAGFDFWEGR